MSHDPAAHLRRLHAWASQDPSGPAEAQDVKAWVLSELEQAMGKAGVTVPAHYPSYLQLRDQNERLKAEAEEKSRDLVHLYSELYALRALASKPGSLSLAGAHQRGPNT